MNFTELSVFEARGVNNFGTQCISRKITVDWLLLVQCMALFVWRQDSHLSCKNPHSICRRIHWWYFVGPRDICLTEHAGDFSNWLVNQKLKVAAIVPPDCDTQAEYEKWHTVQRLCKFIWVIDAIQYFKYLSRLVEISMTMAGFILILQYVIAKEDCIDIFVHHHGDRKQNTAPLKSSDMLPLYKVDNYYYLLLYNVWLWIIVSSSVGPLLSGHCILSAVSSSHYLQMMIVGTDLRKWAYVDRYLLDAVLWLHLSLVDCCSEWEPCTESWCYQVFNGVPQSGLHCTKSRYAFCIICRKYYSYAFANQL